MKRILSLIVLLISLSFCVFSGCSKGETVFLKRPKDTNLEFWITQNVTDVDFSEYEVASPGLIGATIFYGKGYSEKSTQKVTYKVATYPDLGDDGRYITGINISDPNITVYGLTINSATHEFDETMRTHGFTISMNGSTMVAKKGRISISFLQGKVLGLSAEVTNKQGIVY